MDEEYSLVDETMEEIIASTEEENYEIDINDTNIPSDETFDVANVEEPEVVNIEMQEALADNNISISTSNHTLLTNREGIDQHPIGAITGLQVILDDIRRLKDNLCAKNTNQANYYMWRDENPLREDRSGFFVSVHTRDHKISINTRENDIFGVTVSGAGFIGGQGETARDHRYGLVVHSGVVSVRCENDVTVGDYVVSNNHGIAEKSTNNYGFKVISIDNIENILYVTIILNAFASQVCDISHRMDVLNDIVNTIETRITASVNISNAAYGEAIEARERSDEACEMSRGTLDRVDVISDALIEVEEVAASAYAAAGLACNTAQSAYNAVFELGNEAIRIANEAYGVISGVRSDVVNANINTQNALGAFYQNYGNNINDLWSAIGSGSIGSGSGGSGSGGSGSGGSYISRSNIVVSDTIPTTPQELDIWVDISVEVGESPPLMFPTYVYYNNAWIRIGADVDDGSGGGSGSGSSGNDSSWNTYRLNSPSVLETEDMSEYYITDVTSLTITLPQIGECWIRLNTTASFSLLNLVTVGGSVTYIGTTPIWRTSSMYEISAKDAVVIAREIGGDDN